MTPHRKIAAWLAEHPWSSVRQLVDDMGVPDSAARHALHMARADKVRMRCPVSGRITWHYAHQGTPRPTEGIAPDRHAPGRARSRPLPPPRPPEPPPVAHLHRTDRRERDVRGQAIARLPCVGCGTTWRRSRVRAVPWREPRAPEGADVGGRTDLVPVCPACLAAAIRGPRPPWWQPARLHALALEAGEAVASTVARLACCLLLLFAGCGGLDDGIPWPEPGDLIGRGPCESALDCPDGEICHGNEMSSPACHVPCLHDRDCPEDGYCGELVGELRGQRVCFDWPD